MGDMDSPKQPRIAFYSCSIVGIFTHLTAEAAQPRFRWHPTCRTTGEFCEASTSAFDDPLQAWQCGDGTLGSAFASTGNMVTRCRAPLEEGGIVGLIPSTTTQLVSPRSADRPLERQVVLCSLGFRFQRINSAAQRKPSPPLETRTNLQSSV